MFLICKPSFRNPKGRTYISFACNWLPKFFYCYLRTRVCTITLVSTAICTFEHAHNSTTIRHSIYITTEDKCLTLTSRNEYFWNKISKKETQKKVLRTCWNRSNYFFVTSIWSGIHWRSVTEVLWLFSIDETAQYRIGFLSELEPSSNPG